MVPINPFTERGRITDPARFAGRWGELSLIFERIEHHRPVLVTGGPGVGKSSLLTHITQAAATNLDLPDLHAFYLNLAEGEGIADVYRAVAAALDQRGDTRAALEVALLAADGPVLLCLDNAQRAIAAGWGEQVLEELARLARSGRLMLVAALEGPLPVLSEPFALVSLGALAPPEIRLLTEAYLDDTDVVFTPAELRELAQLSASHPAYVQRAAFHLFRSKRYPGMNWRAAYLAEARERPVPGAPLPPEVFRGEAGGRVADSTFGEETTDARASAPPTLPELELNSALFALLALAGGAAIYLLTGSALLALVSTLAGLGLVALLSRRSRAAARRTGTTPRSTTPDQAPE